MKDRVDLKGFLVMVLLTFLWGLNYPAVKIANVGFSPVFNSFLRSLIASVCGISANTAASRYRYGIAKLREALEGKR